MLTTFATFATLLHTGGECSPTRRGGYHPPVPLTVFSAGCRGRQPLRSVGVILPSLCKGGWMPKADGRIVSKTVRNLTDGQCPSVYSLTLWVRLRRTLWNYDMPSRRLFRRMAEALFSKGCFSNRYTFRPALVMGQRSERPQCGKERGELRPKQGVEEVQRRTTTMFRDGGSRSETGG